MSEKIVQLNEAVIKNELKELVRGSVEETLNELLETEVRTPPQQCSLTADDGASLPLEWCMATGGVVHRAAMLRTTRGCPCVCAWIHPQSGWYRRCR